MISDVARSSRILVVDDDPTNVELVKRVLTRAGFGMVESTSDAVIAVSLLRQLQPHVVLLDLRMPGVDGFALMDTMRGEAAAIGCSIIMLTGEADHDIQVAALQRGASDFVTKPFVAPILVARVAGAAEIRELQRRLNNQNNRLQDAIDARTSRLQQALDVLSRAEIGLKRSLEQSQADGNEKVKLIAELAHELRTPLNAICGFSEMMKDQHFGELAPRYVTCADDVHHAALYAVELVNRFLELAKVEAGEEPLTWSTVDVGAVVQESVKLLSHQADQAGVTLDLVVKPGLTSVRTDATKLLQIALNIVSNAVKFTPAGGRVSIEVGPAPQGGAYIIVVRDTGIGIDAKDIADVMRPFGQVRGAQAGRPKGTGLGLPLTRQYVALLGGKFTIASQPGKGTVVTIELPCDPDAGLSPSPARTA